MRYIRNISDDQNKSGDTDNIFRFNLLQDEDIFNFGDYPISINIANSSGYILSMVPEKEFGNSVLKLDFNDQSLKSLTPDNYLLEVEVKFPDGTTATFPTKGGMPFSVNSNLKNTAGHLVPTVTFDEVLSAVDKKVNNYLATVVKGDKGDKGDTGIVDTAKDYTWTGTNTFNKTIIATAGVQGNVDTATKLQTPRKINGVGFDGTSDINVPASNDSDIVHKSGNETINGDKTFNDLNTFKKPIQGGLGVRAYPLTTIAGLSGKLVEYSGKWGVSSDTLSDLPQGGYAILTVYPYTDNVSSGFVTLQYTSGDFYFSDINGTNVVWKKVAKDIEVMHLTGSETVAGDKTFTGNNTFTGKTSFWFKQIQWTSGIMQGTWYIQRMGNWVNAKFDMTANTGTGTTTLSLPVGYCPLSPFVREVEQGVAGLNKNGTVLVSQSYTGANAMTFSYPTNDPWPTA